MNAFNMKEAKTNNKGINQLRVNKFCMKKLQKQQNDNKYYNSLIFLDIYCIYESRVRCYKKGTFRESPQRGY